MTTIAIIGTAGRREDASRIDRPLYDAMFDEAVRAIRSWGSTTAVSGGAAVSDHLAVRAFLEGAVASLRLFLPAVFDGRRYIPDHSVRSNPGRTTNQYHEDFSDACGIDSLGEIAEAIRRGAKVGIHAGFHRRNLEVAGACSHLLAFTFGRSAKPYPDGSAFADFGPSDEGFSKAEAANLKDGGTAHTWGEAWRPVVKRHVNLSLLAREMSMERRLGVRQF